MPGHSFSACGPPQAVGCPDRTARSTQLRLPSPSLGTDAAAAAALPAQLLPGRRQPAAVWARRLCPTDVAWSPTPMPRPKEQKGSRRQEETGGLRMRRDRGGLRASAYPGGRSSHAARSRAVTLRLQAMALRIDPAARCTSAPQRDRSSPHSRRASRGRGSCAPRPHPRAPPLAGAARGPAPSHVPSVRPATACYSCCCYYLAFFFFNSFR